MTNIAIICDDEKHFINLNYSVFILPQIRIMSTRFGSVIVGATINPVAPNEPLPFKESVIISQQLRAPPAAIFTSSGCALTCSPPRLFIYSPLLLCLVSVWLSSLFFSPDREFLRSDCSASSLHVELVD